MVAQASADRIVRQSEKDLKKIRRNTNKMRKGGNDCSGEHKKKRQHNEYHETATYVGGDNAIL